MSASERCADPPGAIVLYDVAPTGQFSESKGEVRFPEIRAAVLEKVIECVSWATCGSAPNAHTICRYFHFKVKFTNSKVPIPEFPIPPEIALDTMMASNFLAC